MVTPRHHFYYWEIEEENSELRERIDAFNNGSILFKLKCFILGV